MSWASFSLLSQASFVVNFKYSFVLTHSCRSFCLIFSFLLFSPVSRDMMVARNLSKFIVIQNKEFVDKRKQNADALIVCETCNSQDFYCKVIMNLLLLLLLLIIHSSAGFCHKTVFLSSFCISFSCCFLCCKNHLFFLANAISFRSYS